MTIEALIRPFKKTESKKFPSPFSVHDGRVVIRCEEHGRRELVDQRAYHVDLGYWYHIGLHPRFSIMKAFSEAAQTGREASFLMGMTSRRNGSDDERFQNRTRFKETLRKSRTEREFIDALHPHLFMDLVNGDTTYRVTNEFGRRFRSKSFTVDEFFDEPSQEIRRLILRSGVSIDSVRKRMTLVGEDEEGKLYRMKTVDGPAPIGLTSNEVQYLYVVCPSTKQEYLLGVPAAMKTPKEARRWTFGLEPSAEFVREA